MHGNLLHAYTVLPQYLMDLFLAKFRRSREGLGPHFVAYACVYKDKMAEFN